MDLTDYWRILRRHWVSVVAIVVGTVALAGVYTMMQPKVYSADATGFVTTGAAVNPALSSVNDALAKSRATSYVDIATSRATAQTVIDQLKLGDTPASLVGRISVVQPLDTVLLKITAKAGTPQAAQALADAWVSALAKQVKTIEDPKGTGQAGIPQVVPVESAALPAAPSSPNPKINLLLGVIVGLMLAAGFVSQRHSVDRKLRTKDDIESKFGVSVVGSVPVADVLMNDTGERARIAVDDDEGAAASVGPASEAFRKLRTNLMYMNVDNPPRIVVVTSPLPGDGKSTVAANLAAAIDASGQDVVLVDGDLRRPSIATMFGLVEGVGLTEVLAGRVQLEDVLQMRAAHPNLRVLGAGSIPPNPSELLGSQSMQQLMRKLSTEAIVVIDAPPLLPVTDAALLAANADGVFVVVSAGKTLDAQLATALDHLAAVEATTLGVILNRVSRRDAGDGYYGEYGGYYNNSTGKRHAKE